MRPALLRLTGLASLALIAHGAAFAQALPAAAKALGAEPLNAVEFSGTGRWFQFGQAPAPGLPWPAFDVSRYVASIDYETAAARVQIARKQVVEAGRVRPAPVEQVVDQYVGGGFAWNRPATGNGAPTAQPAALEERIAEIWSTPQGFLRAARANGATAQAAGNVTEVSFTVAGKYRWVGTLNAQHQVERVRTWIANPILGDTLVETRFSEYKVFDGVPFPARIERSLGGHPVLDLHVTTVKANPRIDLPVPAEAKQAPVIDVVAKEIAPGVQYLTGGTHHSVAIEQRDHVVLVEAPQSEERALAVVAKVKALYPAKPIRYLVNSHVHFDHAGGVRTLADEGATIVTVKANEAYYRDAWAAPRTVQVDRLAQSKKAARFETFTDRHVLNDGQGGQHRIELHEISGSGHNDAFLLVYLPAEKILIEADAYTPLAAGAPAPASVNPFSVNLYENLQTRGLAVEKIAALHGPGLVALNDLKAFIGQPAP
jgi:glyoxylase-like metal-dependent hydrolase (beta-lactamase superfamily II)